MISQDNQFSNQKLSYQIKLLGQSQTSETGQHNLPQIDDGTFVKKSSRKQSIESKESKSYFDQKQFRMHAISSRKGYTNVLSKVNNQDNQFSSITNNKHVKSLNRSRQRTKKAQSGILLGMNKIDSQTSEVEDLYHQYLTLQEIQISKAKQKLQKKIDKYMPKNSSFSQYYGEKKIMIDKQAKKQLNEINNDKFKTIGDQSGQKNNKKQLRKLLLNEILKNKTIDFKQKLRNRSRQKHQSTPTINHPDLNEIGRQRTPSNLDFMNSPTYSDGSEFKSKFLFFPEPKTSRFVRFQSSYNPTPSKMFRNSGRQKQSTSPQQYIDVIKNLQQVSESQTKRSQYLINSSIKRQNEFFKTYEILNNQAVQAIYGFSELKLDEETSDIFRDQLREMWMKNDLNKGKTQKTHEKPKRKKSLL